MSNERDKPDGVRLDGANDRYAEVDDMAERIWAMAREAIEADEADRISDEAVRLLMTAAVKLYAHKSDGEDRTFRPLEGRYDEVVTPTEALTATTEVLRALRLGPMEFGLWSRRRPEDYHLKPDEIESSDGEPQTPPAPGAHAEGKEPSK